MAESRGYFSEIMNMGNDNEMDTEEDDEEKARLYKEPMRRNLLTVFDKAMPVEVADERMSVFLRVRPFSDQELEQEENQGCVDVQNNFMVSAHAPKDSHTFKAQQYGLYKARHHFTFSRVFPESTTQKEFFDCTMLKLVQDFIEGQNCLVFTYGVTNSGKTYTIQGNARDAGILPRGLDVLFNSINGRQRPGMDLKPRMFCDVSKLTPEEEEKERKVKESTLKLNSSEDVDVMTLLGDDASDQSVMNTTQQSDRKGSVESGDTLMAELENRDREETAVDVSVQGQIRFTVWVSFAEIYNEQIFDLLEPLPKKKDARRPVLKLSEDRRGSPYIKGLKEIHVTSADEAYKLLTIGQRNLKTACTRLNQCSSRSHCIFNIKIIRVPDKGDPKMARVSMLSLCDLAGSERQSKTHTTGDRVKEAGNINTSLLTLGRCIELLRYNQQHKDKENRIIPFRDSRLTRLFQNFFCGRGKAAMIVNVSQCASMFDETLNVFKFSAIAKQVVMPPKPAEKPIEPKRKRTTKSTRASSICWEASATPSRTSQQSAAVAEEDLLEEEEEEDDDDLYIEHLEECVEKLETKVKELKHERLLREVEIRREVCQEMQQQFVQIEDTYSHLLKETRRQEAEKFGKKLQLIMDYSQPQPSKRPRLDISQPSTSKDVMVDEDDEWVSSLLLHQEKVKVQEREASLAELRGQVTELQFQVADLTRRNKEAADRADQAEQAQRQLEKDCAEKVAQAERLREAAAQDAQKAVEDLGHSVLVETLSQQLQEVKDRLKEKEKEVCELNEMLTDAGETFHQKEEEIAKLKQAIADDEGKAEQQMETIRELRALLEESKTAVEDSERRLEVKNVSLTDMKGTPHHHHLADTLPASHHNRPQPHQRAPVVMVTPLRSAQTGGSESEQSPDSGVVAFRGGSVESVGEKSPEVLSHLLIPNTPTPPPPPPPAPRSQPRRLPSMEGLRDQGRSTVPSTPEVIVTKTEGNRVMRVVVTPIKKLMTRHTKTSLMRLRLTPNKSQLESSPATPVGKRKGKRKISEVESTPLPPPPAPVNGKKTAAPKPKKESRMKKLKERLSLSMRSKYNLRNRR